MSESASNNMTPEARINPPVREKTIPEINTIDKGRGIFRFLKQTTHESTVKSGDKDQDRPLLALSKRADFLRKYRNRDGKKNETPESRRSARETAVESGKAWDEIVEQYLTQGEVVVNLPGLGEQTSKYTTITPPESKRTPETDSKPPIFLIPGIANDLDSMGGLLLELPEDGREVTCAGFPESQMGNVTPEFATAVENAPGFEPHVEFFKTIIKKMYPDGQDVELWGFSNGAAIVETILQDPDFQKRVPNATLISPAASADMSKFQLYAGGVVMDTIRNLKRLSKYSLTMSRKTPEPEGQRELKKRIFGNYEKKVATNLGLWKDARVREGGKITVVSGAKDGMTRSHLSNESFLENPQVTLVDVKKGTHMTPLLQADKILTAVKDAQSPNAPRTLTI